MPSAFTTLVVQSVWIRVLILWMVGSVLAVLLNHTQAENYVIVFPPSVPLYRFQSVLIHWFSSPWWMPLGGGAAAVIIGLSYPWMDGKMRIQHRFNQEWPSARCIGLFIGINLLSGKLAYTNSFFVTVILTVLSVGLWSLFDRSRIGIIIGILMAIVATAASQLLVSYGVFRYTKPDFMLIRSWIPSIFFAAVVTMGTLGREMAHAEEEEVLQ